MRMIWIIARHTWRVAWRDPLTRLQLGMLGILVVLSAIAAIGSPGAGDGTIQMYAIAYAAVPFALVLVIGQGGGRPHDEVAWWSRPVSQSNQLLGRALGYLMIGSVQVVALTSFGYICMTVVARLPAQDGALWTGLFALFTLPSLITILGGALFWQSVIGPNRYFAPAILGSLTIAFIEYKSSMFYALWPYLPLYNPFPGFLALGLSLPSRLLHSPQISGWLWLNRLAWTLVGMGLIFFVAQRTGSFYVLRRRSLYRWLAIGMFALAVGAFGILTREATHLSLRTTPSIAQGGGQGLLQADLNLHRTDDLRQLRGAIKHHSVLHSNMAVGPTRETGRSSDLSQRVRPQGRRS